MPPILTLGDLRSHGHQLVAVCRRADCRHTQFVNLGQLVLHAGARSGVLPTKGQVHFSERMRCPVCGERGMFIWPQAKPEPPNLAILPNYTIEDWGRVYPYNHPTTIATADNLFVAHAAYAAAAYFYEDHSIKLRQGAFVVADNKRDGPPVIKSADDYRRVREGENNLAGRSIPSIK